jgi:hypothetical protein
MKSRDFVIWLEGFCSGKEILTWEEMNVLKEQMDKVNLDDEKKIMIISEGPPTNPIVIKEPDVDIDFPGKPPNIYM